MTSKFEQLIEYVINDDEQKARELFHNIVVEKSREIYENLMNEEDVEGDEELSEDDEEEIEEGMDDTSGSATEDVMREVETDQDGGMNEEDDADAEFDDEAEDDGEDMTKDIEHDHDDDAGEEDLEDRVVDLEDKLDELMAEFEALMGDEESEMGGDEFDMEPADGDVGGDAYTDDDTSEFDDEEAGMGVMENVSLEKVAPAKMGDNGANTKSPTTFNSGAAGMQGKPVRNVASESNPDGTAAYKAPTSYADKGRGDLPGAGKFKNTPAKGGVNAKLAPAPKPHLAQASGVNTKTPFPKG
jgi:hypothetical protein